MGWLKDDQLEYLLSKFPSFIECQNEKQTQRFWGPVYEYWFTKWPVNMTMVEGLTLENSAEFKAKMTKDKEKQIHNWFFNRTRGSGSGPGRGVTRNFSASRTLAPLQAYMRFYYIPKIKAEVIHQWKLLQLSGSTVDANEDLRQDEQNGTEDSETREDGDTIGIPLHFKVRVAKDMWSRESDSVKADVDRRRGQGGGGGGGDGGGDGGGGGMSEEMRVARLVTWQRGIDNLSKNCGNMLKHINRTTGLSCVLLVGGPIPELGGDLSCWSFCHGATASKGLEFSNFYNEFQKNIMEPFAEHTKYTFPPEERKARAVTTEDRAQVSEPVVAAAIEARASTRRPRPGRMSMGNARPKPKPTFRKQPLENETDSTVGPIPPGYPDFAAWPPFPNDSGLKALNPSAEDVMRQMNYTIEQPNPSGSSASQSSLFNPASSPPPSSPVLHRSSSLPPASPFTPASSPPPTFLVSGSTDAPTNDLSAVPAAPPTISKPTTASSDPIQQDTALTAATSNPIEPDAAPAGPTVNRIDLAIDPATAPMEIDSAPMEIDSPIAPATAPTRIDSAAPPVTAPIQEVAPAAPPAPLTASPVDQDVGLDKSPTFTFNASILPHWLSKALKQFASLSNDRLWVLLLEELLKHEARFGYPVGSPTWIDVNNCPKPLDWWQYEGRHSIDKLPVIDRSTYRTDLRKWWISIQPTARRGTSLLRTENVKNADWTGLQHGGPDGMFAVVICLSWFMVSYPPPLDQRDLEELIDDVTWVLGHLNTPDKNVSTISSSARRRGRPNGTIVKAVTVPSSKKRVATGSKEKAAPKRARQ